ncbi:ornithine cyclodeaminase family protein [Kutzneria viridogrisea]|uniref:Ornithine cyclodeaminase n=2 Tax=Kutzneria TaxID=43356 RepID=W5WAL9_9PSEU|nr:ornithine cyclodeaminase family protein [Kutzneria albida]AHH95239.1 ornithine cyclodeaminase [Kutzneria albida DSM 43870]MBA8927404.1 ornithine cyclodeaminase [Kutzneria viridogrisea]
MTDSITFISESESAALVDEDLALAAAREAFLATATGSTFPVVIGHAAVPDNRFTLKSGSADDLVGVKIGSYWPGNTEVPRHSSTIVLLDPATGRLAAVVEAATANAYRTAAADALAVDTLARPDSRTLTVIGTGHQARYEVGAVTRVRPIERVLVVGRSPDTARAFATEVTARTGLPAEPAEARTAVAAADVVVTATTARQPLFDADWVAPGTHISAMGADGPGKQELPVALYDRASLFCDLPDQSRTIGEFQHAPSAAPVALGAVLAGDAGGRGSAEAITVFDSSGFALQDLALATALLRRRTHRQEGHE